MQKTLKAAVAAFSGGVLLLGGASSLAYWTDADDVAGGTITSGEMTLTAFTCGDWTMVDAPAETFTLASDQIVPGEAIVKTCTSTLEAEGKHLEGTLSVETPSDGAGALADELTYDVSWTVGATAGQTAVTTADDGKTVTATVTVTFPFGVEDNDANGNVAATLDAITFSLLQTDD